MYNVVNTLAPIFLIESSLFLQVRRKTIKSRLSFKFSLIETFTAGLVALERLKNFPLAYNRSNVANTLVPSFLIGSSSFLQDTRTYIKA